MKLYLDKRLSSCFFFVFQTLRRLKFENKVLPLEFMQCVNRLSSSSLVLDLGANIGLVSEI